MPNMLDEKINQNEELYNSTKKELENRIGAASVDYSTLLDDFRNQISYIEKDTMLSKEGKMQKANEIRNKFIDKVNVKSLDHYSSLQAQLDIALLEEEKRKLENFKGLNSDSMPQLIYVNSMVNSISSINDADLLEDVFNYASEEGNFSDELINIIYLKARNLMNNSAENTENEPNAAKSGKNISKINNIISKITKYKTNYTKELTDFKIAFKRAFNQRKYPSNLYIQRDPKDDFRLPSELDNNPWNNSKTQNNPWNK